MGKVDFFWTGIIFWTANKNGYKCTSVSIFVTYFNKYPYPKYFGSENTDIYMRLLILALIGSTTVI